MVNEKLVRDVVSAIEASPENWDQGLFVDTTSLKARSCGTQFCFAGWAAVLAGYVNQNTGELAMERAIADDHGICVEEVAQSVLGFTERQAEKIFYNFQGAHVSDLKAELTEVTGVTFE